MTMTRYYMSYLLAFYVLATIYEGWLLKHALPFILSLRLGVFTPMTLICILATCVRRKSHHGHGRKKKILGLSPMAHSVLYMIWLAVYLFVNCFQLMGVYLWYPMTDPVLMEAFETHMFGEFTFFWLTGFCPWIPMHSHMYKQVTCSILIVAIWPIAGLCGRMPPVHIICQLGCVWLLIFCAAIFYELNGRTAFLQMNNMKQSLQLVKEENDRFETLLESTLPTAVLAQLKTNPSAISQRVDQATVFFADFIRFTEFCANVPSVFVVQLLDDIYARFDAICKRHQVTSIMTIGDCYFAGAGIVNPDEEQLIHCLRAAREMIEELRHINTEKGIDLGMRVGLSTGNVFAGVLGVTRFSYDVWGPAVNDAKKLEAAGEPGRILISHHAKLDLAQTNPAMHFRDGPAVNKKPTYFLPRVKRGEDAP
eukprot:gnl/Trimastix_PCT/3798.p1 GENE.gnl/Trimastix_PCT/3798~~gnl/Trimastix_PCT/3798.p1  ORF type:complete len:423 (-),score=124.20 gnl/Trimastix_PCT/3798:349-1617(-)